MQNTKFQRSPQAHSQSKKEGVAIILDGGEEVFLLNDTASYIWELLEKKQTKPQLLSAMLSTYEADPQELSHDLDEILEKMLSDQIVIKHV